MAAIQTDPLPLGALQVRPAPAAACVASAAPWGAALLWILLETPVRGVAALWKVPRLARCGTLAPLL